MDRQIARYIDIQVDTYRIIKSAWRQNLLALVDQRKNHFWKNHSWSQNLGKLSYLNCHLQNVEDQPWERNIYMLGQQDGLGGNGSCHQA